MYTFDRRAVSPFNCEHIREEKKNNRQHNSRHCAQTTHNIQSKVRTSEYGDRAAVEEKGVQSIQNCSNSFVKEISVG